MASSVDEILDLLKTNITVKFSMNVPGWQQLTGKTSFHVNCDLQSVLRMRETNLQTNVVIPLSRFQAFLVSFSLLLDIPANSSTRLVFRCGSDFGTPEF